MRVQCSGEMAAREGRFNLARHGSRKDTIAGGSDRIRFALSYTGMTNVGGAGLIISRIVTSIFLNSARVSRFFSSIEFWIFETKNVLASTTRFSAFSALRP